MEPIKVYEHKAQYYETDQMGCVHHSNYIRWFEEARTNLLEQVGFSYGRMEELGVISPVLSVSAEYKSMVHYQDVVKIYTKVTSFNGVKFTVTYEVRDAKTNELRTTGLSTHCFLDRGLHPMNTKKEQPEIYELFLQLKEQQP